MTNAELKELVHLLIMCGIMDKTATESGNVTNDEWLRMMNQISKYQEEKEQPEVKGDLISREALKQDFKERNIWNQEIASAIDNAPTVANCLECAKEHEQLAEWLRELKRYKECGCVKLECLNCGGCENGR